MSTITITISATSDAPFPPTIADPVNRTSTNDKNFVTDVKAGDTVIFQKGGDITEIIAITDNTKTCVFASGPNQQADGTWKGTIKSNSEDEESYTITYSVGGTIYSQDPKIKINK